MFRGLRTWTGGLGIALGLGGCDSIEHAIGERAVEIAMKRAPDEPSVEKVSTAQAGKVIAVPANARVDDLTVDTPSDTPSEVLPPDWPPDIPLFPDSRIGTAVKDGRGWELTLDTPQPAAKVVAYYKANLAHLDERGSMDMGAKKTLVWVDEEPPMQVTISVGEDEKTKSSNVHLSIARQ